jgi:hypothetical protein
MKRVAKTLAIHVFCIILFSYLYYTYSIHFDNSHKKKFKYHNPDSKLEQITDFLLFGTTIQAGVGISDILPISTYGKMLMIIQQLLMMSINVITIYVFTK